ncbi:FAD-binding protein [Bacteroidota bacterium]|nr:FAD-binding protein [Bacteroidota bacterium]
MPNELTLRVSPEIAATPELLRKEVERVLGGEGTHQPEKKKEAETILGIHVRKRSIDARGRTPVMQLQVQVFGEGEQAEWEAVQRALTGPEAVYLPEYRDVRQAEEVHIIGAGPAGLFAALKVIEQGLKPVVWERGKDVRERVKDLKGINVHHVVNPDSNYCFGEGGAGTYSDGKLYTRSKKRGDVQRILELLVGFGAVPEILVEAHPHIGTNKLPKIIAAMRECILSHGGEVHFGHRVVDLVLEGDGASRCIAGLEVMKIDDAPVRNIPAKHVILATGHSARDIFELLVRREITLEAKPLAIGVRVEHPQALIDSIQYSCESRGEYLPAAPYSVVHQVEGRGVYSFCMCPGGVVAPCATKPGEIVTNGWSSSRRARSTANSGIVVELELADFKDYEEEHGPLAAMAFQAEIERKAWEAGGRTQTAPAQRLVDFVEGRVSKDLPKTSYAPGLRSVDLAEVLPDFIVQRLREGFVAFDRKMKGFLTNEAVVHAPETRTSSPVRIPRDEERLVHPEIEGLYPCGEGAGYAGGIISAAMDGERVAEAVVRTVFR